MVNDKRQLLIEALAGTLDSLEMRYASPDQRAAQLVDRVIAEGWQPKEEPFKEEWRKIPGYDYWEMSNGNMVRHVLTKECVPITHVTDEPITITIHDNFGKDQTVFLMELAERIWPKGLIGLSLKEAAQLFNEPGEIPEEYFTPTNPNGNYTYSKKSEVEWRVISDLPSKNFEISNTGLVRHKQTGRLFEPEFDIDYNLYMVKLIINEQDYRIVPEHLIERLWGN